MEEQTQENEKFLPCTNQQPSGMGLWTLLGRSVPYTNPNFFFFFHDKDTQLLIALFGL
jgi:hypothetical protein